MKIDVEKTTLGKLNVGDYFLFDDPKQTGCNRVFMTSKVGQTSTVLVEKISDMSFGNFRRSTVVYPVDVEIISKLREKKNANRRQTTKTSAITSKRY